MLDGPSGILCVSLGGLGLIFFVFIMVAWGKELLDEWNFWNRRQP